MKRIIFAISSVILLYFIWPSPEPEPVPEYIEAEIQPESFEEVKVEQEQEPQSKSEPHKVVKKTEPAQRPKNTVSSGRRMPPDMVEFELLSNGWAVAHGDILLGKLQTKIDGTRGRFKPKPSVLWDSNQIPFGFGEGFSRERVQEIMNTLDDMSLKTNLQFYLVDLQELPRDYILFTVSDERCASYLGKVGGQQPIFLKDNCGPKEIRHEVMHALGFVHEQSRKDRDQYVKINWENIKPGYENQFDIAPNAYLENYRGFVFSFDYQSVMLYSSYHFTKSNNLKTIESLTNKEIAPEPSSLSAVDIQRINYLYN